MIKVIDKVTGTAILIEVTGKPCQYQVRIGKVGTWTVARGRTAGTVKTGEKWERPQYHMSLRQAIEGAIALISESEGMPKEAIVLDGSEAWKVLLEQEQKRMDLIKQIDLAYQKFLDEHGKDLAGLTKLLAGKGVVVDDEDPDAADEVEDEVVAEAAKVPSEPVEEV